jgi:hypothetical protein
MKLRAFERECSGKPAQVFGAVVALAVGLGVGLGAGMWPELAGVLGRQEYASASGTLTELSEAEKVRSKKRMLYRVDAAYTFMVEGREYTGSTVGRAPPTSLRATDERALRAAYESKQPVTLRYDAADPSRNYLECPDTDANATTGLWFGSAVAALFTGVGAVSLVMAACGKWAR